MAEAGYGLIGEKLGHSFSPYIHGELGNYDYRLIELKRGELAGFLKRGAFKGLNVTVPYKKDVMPYCAWLSPEAARIGSVNTIVNTGGLLRGYNTDYYGFVHMLRTAGIDVKDKKTLVLGSGGASLTVRTALGDLGARSVTVVSRGGEDNYGNLERHAGARVIVNTTPVGMYPNVEAAPLSLDPFPHLEAVADIIYNPSKTRLLLDAEKRGLCFANGLAMLVAQAKAAAELFLGRSIPDEKVDEITSLIEKRTKNILLIGMPGCGKTTVGKLLARALGRGFADTDELIVKESGRAIPDIFASDGEEAFRELEHSVIAREAKKSSLVIATGGGSVLREDNRDAMRQNSFIVYIRRDIGELPSAGRPVSQSTPIEELYGRRAPIYEALADAAVDNETSAQAAAGEIIRRLGL
ncbi:shikimate kinase [Cloacibacillus sp. An23]|uniref:shikimate kinase n=1 Tax=Cloacibacillus sp. An23 TaxID=1965591 RepID=UPI000B3702B2|nr:shikimate kinase [Cloacibacillus sp. An23]OUO92278.1 shikimate kinase [Cloacibacillus sp. An23]